MATDAVGLPEGFVIDVPTPKRNAGEEKMAVAVKMTPEEQQFAENSPEWDRQLAAEIARTKDPKILAILQEEQAKRQGGKFVNASATTGSLPSGFVVDQKQGPLDLNDFLTKPLTKTVPAPENAAGTAEYLLNAAKRGVMSIPGMPGDIVALARAAGMSPDAFLAAGPLGPALKFLAQQQEEQPKGKEPPFGSGDYLAKKLLMADPNMEAPGPGTEFAGKVTQFVSSMAGGPIKAGITEGVVPAIKSLAGLTGLGTLFTAGGEAGKAAIGGPVGELIGSVLTLPLAGAGSRFVSVFTKEGRDIAKGLVNEGKGDITGIATPFVQRTVENRLASGMKDFAPAEANINEASALQSKLNATLPPEQQILISAGRATGAPGVVADELAARKSSNAAVSAALQSDQRNADAVLSYIKGGPAPAVVSGETAVDAEIKAFNARLEALRKDSDQLRVQAANTLPNAKNQVAALDEEARKIVPPPAKLTAEQRGQTLTREQVIEKEKKDAISNALYGKAGTEANKLGAEFSQDAINLAARRMSANPILAYDENNLPGVIRAIRVASNPKGDVVPPSLLERGMAAPVEAAATAVEVPKLKYEDISAMRTAVNQDISAEMASTNANKNQRISALMEMKATIDGAIAESDYPSVAKLYRAATEYYRNTYSPMFNQGINSKLMMRDSYGNPKVFSEKILDQYNSNVTNANAFLKLFGQNPQALATMEDHWLSKFAQPTQLGGVVKDGIIDLKAYELFLKKHGAVLNTLADNGLPSLKQFADLAAQRGNIAQRGTEIMASAQRLAQQLSDRSGALLDYGKEIANSELGKLLGVGNPQKVIASAMKDPAAMTRLTSALGEKGSQSLSTSVMRDLTERLTYPADSGKVGLNNELLSKWLQENSKPVSIMFKAAYGEQEGAAHLQRLKDASRMLSILDRVPTPGLAAADMSIGRDPLREKVGFTMRSLFNTGRAILQGRTSEADAAVLFGGQALSHVVAREYNKLMQQVASDPQSSKYLLEMLKNGAAPVQTKETALSATNAMLKLFGRAGYYYLGGRYYIPSSLKMAPNALNSAAQETH